MKKALVFSVLAALAICSSAQDYNNPIIPGFHPDPSVCRAGDKYYIVNSSFHYFPGVPIFESDDLKSWRQIGNVLDRESQLPLGNTNSWLGIYAPTIRYNDGTYYMITTNVGNGGNFMVTASDPQGPWSEPIWLEQQGIDPSLYFEDGKCYMVSNPDNVITLCEIDPVSGKTLSGSRALWEGTGGRYPEGPHIYKKDGYYYLLISEGGTELAHMLTIARSRDIYGPYESCPSNPILTHCSKAGQSNIIQATGHGDFVQDGEGNWWIVFLAYRNYGGSYHHLGRETFLAPVQWEKGEWPVINEGRPVTEVSVPEPSTYLNTASKGFAEMGPEWLNIQIPVKENYELTESSALRLHCSESDLTNGERPTFVGRRQEFPSVKIETEVDASKLLEGGEAGLTVYQIFNGHAEIAVKRFPDGSLHAVSRCIVKSLLKEDDLGMIDTEKVILRIESDGNVYLFSALPKSSDGGKANEYKPAPVECPLLSTEVVGGFTGVVTGIYATGSGSADFAYFDYRERTAD